MCTDDDEYMEDGECDELFTIIPSLPGDGEFEEGESEYSDLDDEEFDIDF